MSPCIKCDINYMKSGLVYWKWTFWREGDDDNDDDDGAEDDAESLPMWPAIWYNGFWRV